MNDFVQQLAPSWSPVNIGITVLLFLLYWPFALIMLAYIVWGGKFGLDLRRPETFSIFAKRLGTAWKAAVNSFNSKN